MTAASFRDGTSHSPQKAGTSPLRTGYYGKEGVFIWGNEIFKTGLDNLIFQFLEFYSEDLSKLQYPVF